MAGQGATIREAPMGGINEWGTQDTQLARDCILQVIVRASLEDLVHLVLQIIKQANHFDVCLHGCCRSGGEGRR